MPRRCVGAVDVQRRAQARPLTVDARAHQGQWLGDAVHRALRERRVADEPMFAGHAR